MRYLTFDSSDEQSRKKYAIIYEGIIVSPRGFDIKSEARVIGNVLSKFEVLGTPKTDGRLTTYELTKSGGVALEDAEHKLLIEAISTVKFTGQFARVAADSFEWLEKAPTTEAVSVEK